MNSTSAKFRGTACSVHDRVPNVDGGVLCKV